MTAWVASVAAHCQRLLDIRPKAVAASTFIAPLSIIVSFKMYYIGWRGSSLTSHHIHMGGGEGGRELGIVRRLGNCVDRGCLARERRRQREDERARLLRKSCATGRRRHRVGRHSYRLLLAVFLVPHKLVGLSSSCYIDLSLNNLKHLR